MNVLRSRRGTDLDAGGVAHRLWGDVGLTGLSGDQGHPKNLLEGVSDCLHIRLLVRSHHYVDVPAGLWSDDTNGGQRVSFGDKAEETAGRLTDIRSHARIQSGDHGLHGVLGSVQDRLHHSVTCYSLRTRRRNRRSEDSARGHNHTVSLLTTSGSVRPCHASQPLFRIV